MIDPTILARTSKEARVLALVARKGLSLGLVPGSAAGALLLSGPNVYVKVVALASINDEDLRPVPIGYRLPGRGCSTTIHAAR